jgi:hypothetical protein
MRYAAFSSVCLLALLAVPAQAWLAQAGQLFPPQNIGSNANVKCPSGQVLTWNVDHVDCVDPTAGVTFACPSGQVLTSIVNGRPVCLILASGGGITGGCSIPMQASCMGGNTICSASYKGVSGVYGKGCIAPTTWAWNQVIWNDSVAACNKAAAPGYSCGPVGQTENSFSGSPSYLHCQCSIN